MHRLSAFSLRHTAWAAFGACCLLWGAVAGAQTGAATAGSGADSNAVSHPLMPDGMKWLPAADDADIEKAMALAKAENKPVLLYWGASWCPPCNQLKATLFQRQDFLQQARLVVPVMIDGDLPGAQKLGARFKVRGYPTMILMTATGTEITRLPGEVDAPQVMRILQAGMAGGRPVKSILADAKAGKALKPQEWNLLAYYAWELDEQSLVPQKKDLPGLLSDLAQRHQSSPQAQPLVSTRLLIKALTTAPEDAPVLADAATRQRLQSLVQRPHEARLHADLLANNARELALAMGGRAKAPEFVKALDQALARLSTDRSLSRADRGNALTARVQLARLDLPKDAVQVDLPKPLVQTVQAQARSNEREIKDGYERQAVVTQDAHMLALAGQWSASDELLKRQLDKSHSPYYLMSQLGSNARKLGKKDEALQWYEQAYAKSVGPATRLQWGAGYLGQLVDLAPQQGDRIEKAALAIFQDASKDSGAFYERSARSLQRVGSRLSAWGQEPGRADHLRRIQQGLDALCAQVPVADGQKAACQSLLKKA